MAPRVAHSAGECPGGIMKQLLQLSDPRLAQSLVDYLSTRGLHCELTQSELGITVWLADESRSLEAEAEVKRFIQEPYHPRYAEASWQSGQHPNSRIDYSAGQHGFLGAFFHAGGPSDSAGDAALRLSVWAAIHRPECLSGHEFFMPIWRSSPAGRSGASSPQLLSTSLCCICSSI